MEKITVIGFTSSGKTCYLAGMYDAMSYGIKNFSLIEHEPEQDIYLQKLWEDISNSQERQWPVPNDAKRTYSFALCHSFEPVIDFEWLDYPGGALTDLGFGLLDEIKSQLADSSCLLVLINGESFAYDGSFRDARRPRITANSAEDYQNIVKRNLKLNKDLVAIKKLSEIGLELNKRGQHLPPIALVVTKSDLIEDRWIDCVSPIIHESFESIFGINTENDRLVMVSAVTLGEGIADGANADPVDIELPIAYAVLAMLCDYIQRARVAKTNNQQSLNKKDTFWGRVIHTDELKQLRKDINKIEQQITKFSKDALRLLDLFDDDTVIYVNGDQRKLRSFFEKRIRG